MSTIFLELMSIFPELFLVSVSLILLIFGAFNEGRKFRTICYVSIISLVLTAFFSFLLSDEKLQVFSGLFVINGYTQFFKSVVLIAGAFVLFMSFKHLEREEINRFEFPVLLLLASLGMLVMISSADFLTLFMGIELQSLSLYILTAFQRDKLISSEAGLKYFILGALSTAFVLYGISLIYGYCGTTEFFGVYKAFKVAVSNPLPPAIGLVLIFSGMAFKVSLVPFHMWTPDVYEGSPTPVTAFLTSAPKIAAFVLWIRLMVEVFPSYVDLWQTILMVLAIASMVLGAFLALMQTNIKRLLAYSTISHMGFALLGLLESNFKGVSSVLLYLMIYLVMAIGIFAFVLNLRKHGKPVESIEDFAGLSKENPLTAFASALILFSLAGLPPFAGFFAKLHVFISAVQGGFYKTAVIGLMASVIAAAYYLKIVKIMYFDQSTTNGGGIRFDRVLYSETLWIMILSAVVVSTYIFYPDLISAPIEAALRDLGGAR